MGQEKRHLAGNVASTIDMYAIDLKNNILCCYQTIFVFLMLFKHMCFIIMENIASL